VRRRQRRRRARRRAAAAASDRRLARWHRLLHLPLLLLRLLLLLLLRLRRRLRDLRCRRVGNERDADVGEVGVRLAPLLVEDAQHAAARQLHAPLAPRAAHEAQQRRAEQRLLLLLLLLLPLLAARCVRCSRRRRRRARHLPHSRGRRRRAHQRAAPHAQRLGHRQPEALGVAQVHQRGRMRQRGREAARPVGALTGARAVRQVRPAQPTEHGALRPVHAHVAEDQ
jgi:hypothetical protein